MDHPYYSVTVAHLTAGWSYTAVEGVDHDLAADWVLAHPFRYRGSFDSPVFPAQLTPSEVTITLLAKSAAVCPQPQPGDLLSFTLRVGVAGPVLARISAARVTEPVMDVDLTHEAWPVQLTITAVDLLADLAGNAPLMVGDSRRRWMERASQIASSIGRSLGRGPLVSPSNSANGADLQAGWSGSARDILTAWCWSGVGLTKNAATGLYTIGPLLVTPYHVSSPGAKDGSGAYPVGYTWAAVSTGSNVLPVIPDPSSDVKYMVSDTNLSGTEVLPLRMVVSAGRVTLMATAAGTHKAAIAASYCELPARLRLGREHVPNAALVSGSADDTASTDERPFTYELRTGDALVGDARSRDVPTMAILGTYSSATPDTPTVPNANAATIAGVFAAAEAEARGTPWTFDAFTFRPARMPQADAEATLPLLMVIYPGELEAGGYNLRPHVTLYGVDADARPGLGDTPIRGWVMAWEVATVDAEDGGGLELEWKLTTTPGAGPAGSPITHAEYEALAGARTYADIDPIITHADLIAIDN